MSIAGHMISVGGKKVESIIINASCVMSYKQPF